MKYKLVLHHSEEGYGISSPGLPGCWSQGETEAEALDNIRDAIQEYAEVMTSPAPDPYSQSLDGGGKGCLARGRAGVGLQPTLPV